MSSDSLLSSPFLGMCACLSVVDSETSDEGESGKRGEVNMFLGVSGKVNKQKITKLETLVLMS